MRDFLNPKWGMLLLYPQATLTVEFDDISYFNAQCKEYLLQQCSGIVFCDIERFNLRRTHLHLNEIGRIDYSFVSFGNDNSCETGYSFGLTLNQSNYLKSFEIDLINDIFKQLDLDWCI